MSCQLCDVLLMFPGSVGEPEGECVINWVPSRHLAIHYVCMCVLPALLRLETMYVGHYMYNGCIYFRAYICVASGITNQPTNQPFPPVHHLNSFSFTHLSSHSSFSTFSIFSFLLTLFTSFLPPLATSALNHHHPLPPNTHLSSPSPSVSRQP